MAREMHRCAERVYVNLDGERVPADSDEPKVLRAPAGADIPLDEARRLGLTGGKQSKVGPDSAPEPEPEPHPVEPDSAEATHVCSQCGFEAASAAGLGAHQRKHEGEA